MKINQRSYWIQEQVDYLSVQLCTVQQHHSPQLAAQQPAAQPPAARPPAVQPPAVQPSAVQKDNIILHFLTSQVFQ